MVAKGSRQQSQPVLDYIVPQLRPLAIEVKALTPDPKNPRRHSETDIEKLKSVLVQYGQRKPIVVLKDGLVVKAGNGTLEAARRAGWTHVAAVVVDEDDASATGFAIADNRMGELSSWDESQLADNLQELLDDGFAIEQLGWDSDELSGMLEGAEATSSTPGEATGSVGGLPGVPVPAPAPPSVNGIVGVQPHLRVPIVFFVDKERAVSIRALFKHPTLETEMNNDLFLQLVEEYEKRQG